MKVLQNTFLPMLLVLFLVTGCTSMTPRFSIYSDQSELDENQVALLQIPNDIQLLSFDDKVPSHNVRRPDGFQSTLKHPYREVLIKSGVHYLMFRYHYRQYRKYPDGKYQVMQKEPFMAAFEAMPSHTYRLQTRGFVNGKYFYGWIESIPKLMTRHKIKLKAANYNEQFRYWYDQDWKIVAAGVTLDDNGKPKYQEIYGRAKRLILQDVAKAPKIPPRETYWPKIEDAIAASKGGVEKIKPFIQK